MHNKGRAQTFAAYAQDDWEVRSRLTLSLGVRWEPFFAFYEVDQPQPVFRPGEQSTLYPSAPPGLLYAGDPGIPRGGHPTLWGNVAPRLAAAWSLDKKTSVRTAYGRFYDTARFFNFPKTLVFTPPYSVSRTTNDVQFSDPYAGKNNPFPYLPPQTAQELANYQFSRPVRVTSVLQCRRVRDPGNRHPGQHASKLPDRAGLQERGLLAVQDGYGSAGAQRAAPSRGVQRLQLRQPGQSQIEHRRSESWSHRHGG